MEVVVFHVLDPAERTLPFEKPMRFRDLESGEEVLTRPQVVREEYLRRIAEFTGRYEHDLRAAGIDYCLLDTSQPLDLALMAYLSARSRTV
jgi:hypothetical protein